MYVLPKTWTTANQRHVHCMILTYYYLLFIDYASD